MATKTTTHLIDDLDGTDADSTLKFSLEGINYEIDLSKANAGHLREILKPYVKAGRMVAGRGGSTPRKADKDTLDAIRAWAKENGHEVSDRGRIPRAVVDAYNAK